MGEREPFTEELPGLGELLEVDVGLAHHRVAFCLRQRFERAGIGVDERHVLHDFVLSVAGWSVTT
jgi:hypothetical protein